MKYTNNSKKTGRVASSVLFALLSVLFVSCSQEEFLPQETTALQFVVSDFPAFQDSSPESGEVPQAEGSVLTRAIGTQDEGKTAWANEDKILVHLYSQKYGDQAVTLTFDAENNTWESDGGTLSYLENETPTITAVYAPDCEIKSDKTIGLLEGKQYGEAEYIHARTTISENSLDINFESGRTYSRLRIAGLANQTLTVTTTNFTPAGAPQAEGSVTYTLTTDNNGNAFLYGVFAEGATVIVKQGDITLKDYTFTAEKNPNGTEHNKSYALDARPVIDGTLGGKAEATEDDITALVEQLKEYVDNGITTIIVPGSKSAIITVGNITETAIGEAIYRLSGNGNYDENNPYNGKIDLLLPDVTEIVAMEFYAAFALNSITLPKVTTVGDGAFTGCYYLKKMTFGSVVTSINQSNSYVFYEVGKEVDGGSCDLVLNCGQLQTEDTYKPDLENNVWFKPSWGGNVTWKSITLTHTGDCDECKANQ